MVKHLTLKGPKLKVRSNVEIVNWSNTQLQSKLKQLPDNNEILRLMDVGCSGGVDKHWLDYFKEIDVTGFDPLLDEVDRLNNLFLVRHRYFAKFVGEDKKEASALGNEASQVHSGSTFSLTSASAVQEKFTLQDSSYTEMFFNSGRKPRFTKETISIDAFLVEHKEKSPNFLKIDTDGHDFFVLRGARRTLDELGLFGIQVECQFHGSPGSESNTFSNIDSLLREAGFMLFHLETWNYTRAALPGKFVYDLPGQTDTGSVQWGEALYFRNPELDAKYALWLYQNLGTFFNLIKVLLVHSLDDVAASFVLAVEKAGGSSFTWKSSFFDSIVPANPYGLSRYEKYIELFNLHPEYFYSTAWVSAEKKGGTLSKSKLIALIKRVCK